MGENCTTIVIRIICLYLVLTLTAYSQNYSFEKEAFKAKWIVSIFDGNGFKTENVTQQLPFNKVPGNFGQEAGISARKKLEDNTESEKVIVARPYNTANSVIQGTFPKITSLPENAKIRGNFGFAFHKDNDYEHEFSVYIHHYIGGIEKRELLFKEKKSFNNTLGYFEIDLSRFKKKVVFFELEIVNIGGNQNGNTPIWNNIEVIGDFRPKSNLANKIFLIKPRSGVGYLEIDKPWEDFAPLQIDKLTRDTSQRFILKEAGQGYYYIQSTKGKVLSLDLSDPNKGKVYFTDLVGMDHQKWSVISSSGTSVHYIKSILGNFLEVKLYNFLKSPVGVGLINPGYQNWELVSFN